MSLRTQLHVEIIKQMSPGKGKFLMCKTPLEWNWPASRMGFIEQSEYDLVGYMPQQDALYYVRSAQEVYAAYSTVIKSAKPVPTDEYLEEVKNLDGSIAKARAKLDEDMARMRDEKEKAQQCGEFLDEDSWLQESGWEDTLEADKKLKKTLEDKKNQLTEEWDSQHREALEAIKKSEGAPGYVKIVTNQKLLPVSANFRVEMNGQDWARRVKIKGGVATEIKLSKPCSMLEKIKAKLGLSKDFILEIIGEDKAHNFNLQAEAGEADISIKFKAYTTVPVSPDPDWYHSGYLAKIAKFNRWRNKLSTDAIFGHQGIFHSIITGFVAVYQPTLTIRMPKASLQSVKHALSGSKSVSLGTFAFDSSRQDFTDDGDSITIASTAEIPQIIGVIVDKPVLFMKQGRLRSCIKNSYVFVLFSISVLLAIFSVLYTYFKN